MKPRGLSKALEPIYVLERALGNEVDAVLEPMGSRCPLQVTFKQPLHFEEIEGRLGAPPPGVFRWENRESLDWPLEAGYMCERTRHAIAGPLPESGGAGTVPKRGEDAVTYPVEGPLADPRPITPGLRDYEKARNLMNEHADLMDFVGPRPEALVTAAERALGLVFPRSYRRFVRELGAGDFGSAEFYGVLHENFRESAVPDAVWLTLTWRADAALPPNLVTVCAGIGGEVLCVDCGAVGVDGDAPVVSFVPGRAPDTRRHDSVARDFGTLLLELVRDEIGEVEDDDAD